MAGLRWNRREEQRLLESVGGPVGENLRRRANRAADRAQQLCPVSPEGSNGNLPGHLRDSIEARSGRDGEGVYAEYGTDVEYALPVELGSRPHVIESHGDYPLRSADGRVFGKRVNHPGTKASPFLRPAMDALREQ